MSARLTIKLGNRFFELPDNYYRGLKHSFRSLFRKRLYSKGFFFAVTGIVINGGIAFAQATRFGRLEVVSAEFNQCRFVLAPPEVQRKGRFLDIAPHHTQVCSRTHLLRKYGLREGPLTAALRCYDIYRNHCIGGEFSLVYDLIDPPNACASGDGLKLCQQEGGGLLADRGVPAIAFDIKQVLNEPQMQSHIVGMSIEAESLQNCQPGDKIQAQVYESTLCPGIDGDVSVAHACASKLSETAQVADLSLTVGSTGKASWVEAIPPSRRPRPGSSAGSWREPNGRDLDLGDAAKHGRSLRSNFDANCNYKTCFLDRTAPSRFRPFAARTIVRFSPPSSSNMQESPSQCAIRAISDQNILRLRIRLRDVALIPDPDADLFLHKVTLSGIHAPAFSGHNSETDFSLGAYERWKRDRPRDYLYLCEEFFRLVTQNRIQAYIEFSVTKTPIYNLCSLDHIRDAPQPLIAADRSATRTSTSAAASLNNFRRTFVFSINDHTASDTYIRHIRQIRIHNLQLSRGCENHRPRLIVQASSTPHDLCSALPYSSTHNATVALESSLDALLNHFTLQKQGEIVVPGNKAVTGQRFLVYELQPYFDGLGISPAEAALNYVTNSTEVPALNTIVIASYGECEMGAIAEQNPSLIIKYNAWRVHGESLNLPQGIRLKYPEGSGVKPAVDAWKLVGFALVSYLSFYCH